MIRRSFTPITMSQKLGQSSSVYPQKKWILIGMLLLGCLSLVSIYLHAQRRQEITPSTQVTRAQGLSDGRDGFNPTRVLVSDSDGNISSRDINNTFIPPKTIIMWWGQTIPSGWVECNGENGTPNLRGRFPLAYDNSNNATYASRLGETAGEKEVTLNISHLPPHTHTVTDNSAQDCRDGTFSGKDGCWMSGPPVNQDRTTSSVGNGVAHNNMPPYFVLRFIMKL